MVNSGKTAITNFIWRFFERFGAQLVSFVVSIVLARILSPDDYGMVALVMVFTSIMQVFVDSGLGSALVQKKETDNIDFSTVFFTNILFCSTLYVVLFLNAPLISKFYNNMSLTMYIRVLGLTVLISGIKNVQQAYVTRNLLFKKFFFSTIIGTFTAGIVGIGLALSGFGVWALVAQQVINVLIDTIILWLTVKWRPDFVFSFSRLKVLFGFGSKLLLSAILDTTYSNIRSLIIGKCYSSSDLAQYNRGRQFPNLVIQNINDSIDSILLPIMSKEQNNKERIREMTQKSIKLSIFIIAPLMIGLCVIGEPLVRIVLSDKWLPSIWYMRMFCMSFLFWPIHTSNLNAIKSMGRSDIFLKLEIEKKIVGLLVVLATVFVSVKAMAAGLLIESFFGQMINCHPNKKMLNYGYFDQIKDILPIIFLTIVMACLIYPVKYVVYSDCLLLIIQVVSGAIIYLVGSKLLHIDSYEYLLEIIKVYLKKKAK